MNEFSMNEKMNGQESQVFVPRNRKRSETKSRLAQLMATAAFGMMVLSVGSLLTAPTIINGALYKEHLNSSNSTTNPMSSDLTTAIIFLSSNINSSEVTTITSFQNQFLEQNEELNNKTISEDMLLTKTQASWIGSVMFIVQPVGSIVSGFIQGHLGRRNGMMATSVVQLIGWLSLYFCINVASLFTAAILMGLSIGFMEAPGLSFLGEVIEPRYRGSFANIAMNMWLFGVLLEYLLGAVLNWRLVFLASAAVPVINFFMLLVIPESPTFLLLQGKERQAEASLRWLRGWTDHDVIRDEYEALVESLNIPHKHGGTYLTPNEKEGGVRIRGSSKNSKGQLELLCERRVRFPIMLIALLFLTQHSVALAGPKPFLVNIFESLDMQLSPHWILVCSGALQLIGIIICACAIRWTGKRTMLIVSGCSSSLICLLLAIYMYIRPGVPIIPMVLFSINFLMNGLGIMSLPWCLVAEVFPTECRGSAAGIAAATSYILGFITTITYKPLEQYISLWGCLLIYTVIGIIGTTVTYFKLPETEGKTLTEIQLLFRSKTEQNQAKPPKGHYY